MDVAGAGADALTTEANGGAGATAGDAGYRDLPLRVISTF